LIFGFILRRWYLQTLLVAIILNIPPLSQYLSSIIYNSLSIFRPTGLDFLHRKSKKYRQHSGQKKKDKKGQTTIYKTIHIALKIE
jgi:hypothetical protein